MVHGGCARSCVRVTVKEKHWRVAAGVFENGVKGRQRDTAGNDWYELLVLLSR